MLTTSHQEARDLRMGVSSQRKQLSYRRFLTHSPRVFTAVWWVPFAEKLLLCCVARSVREDTLPSMHTITGSIRILHMKSPSGDCQHGKLKSNCCWTVFSLGTHIITEVTHGGHICRGHNRATQFRCLSILKAMLTTLYCIHGVLDWVSITVIKHCEQKQVGEKSIYFNSSQLAAHHPGSQERD